MKNKYRIIYDTDDIQKISDCFGMDKLLYTLLEIKIKNLILNYSLPTIRLFI